MVAAHLGRGVKRHPFVSSTARSRLTVPTTQRLSRGRPTRRTGGSATGRSRRSRSGASSRGRRTKPSSSTRSPAWPAATGGRNSCSASHRRTPPSAGRTPIRGPACSKARAGCCVPPTASQRPPSPRMTSPAPTAAVSAAAPLPWRLLKPQRSGCRRAHPRPAATSLRRMRG